MRRQRRGEDRGEEGRRQRRGERGWLEAYWLYIVLLLCPFFNINNKCVCVCVLTRLRCSRGRCVPVARWASAMVSFSDLLYFCEMKARLLNDGKSREGTEAVC